MRRGGRLVIGIGCGALAMLVILWGRAQTLRLTEGESLIALWPVWLLAGALAPAAAWLLYGVSA